MPPRIRGRSTASSYTCPAPWSSNRTSTRAARRGRALAREEGGEALAVSICAGCSRATSRDVGESVRVTVDACRDGGSPRGQAIAEAFVGHAWGTRDYQSFTLLSVAEAVARAKDGKPGDKPLIGADYTDNPGGGGYGDATGVLSGLVEAGVDRAELLCLVAPP